jgi:hypothetical protein
MSTSTMSPPAADEYCGFESRSYATKFDQEDS